MESAGFAAGGADPVEQVLADALLVTSELATNAIRHAGGIVEFSASVSEEGLRLIVTDASTEPPVTLPRQVGAFTAGGYGWPLICRLTRSVAVTPMPEGGKRIEVVVPLDTPSRSSQADFR
ncbi:ATP-binding protein [Streptomyces sp. NPDC003038]|uniref:ATP-binding protein n=1 Tax=unclassified Streptomyces TaxID=2593676 RepID=UPI0033A38274